MFGGLGIYGEDRFFAIVHDDALYLRVGAGNRADFERAGMSPFRPYTDRAVTMPYYELPAEILEDEAALRLWVGRSLQAATTGGGRAARTPAARRQRIPR
jgi:DNA transformation protein